MESKVEYKIDSNLVTLRLDKALSVLNKNYSRVYFSNMIKNSLVLVNGKVVSPSYNVKENDLIECFFKDEDSSLKPYEFKLDVVYEDEDVLLINKPKGLVVHPGGGHENDTLVNALIYNKKKLSTINGALRVGIVHRIDKDTSGLLLICKNDNAHIKVAKQLEDHTMHRSYVALVDGSILKDTGKIIGSIGRDKNNRLKMCIDPVNGKSAITHFKVLKRYEKYTLIECNLETGRTHQIRVHMSSINHAIVGDVIYGGSNKIYNNGQLLHAYKLTFIHPTTQKEMVFEAPLPDYFLDVLKDLK